MIANFVLTIFGFRNITACYFSFKFLRCNLERFQQVEKELPKLDNQFKNERPEDHILLAICKILAMPNIPWKCYIKRLTEYNQVYF